MVFVVASSVLYIENKSWLLRGHAGITADKKEGVQCRGEMVQGSVHLLITQ